MKDYILETATNDPNEGYGLSGLEVHIKPVQVISNLPDSLSFEQMKSYLRQYRNFRNAIHVILGTKKMRNTYPIYGPDTIITGKTVDLLHYFWDDPMRGGLGWSDRKAIRYAEHYSSGGGDIDRQDYLDQVGVWVFVTTIQSFEGNPSKIDSAVALITSHEIGHALGMGHVDYVDYSINNLMVSEFDIGNPNFIYGDYWFFLLESLDDSDGDPTTIPPYSICTTDILGRENVAFGFKIIAERHFPFSSKKFLEGGVKK